MKQCWNQRRLYLNSSALKRGHERTGARAFRKRPRRRLNASKSPTQFPKKTRTARKRLACRGRVRKRRRLPPTGQSLRWQMPHLQTSKSSHLCKTMKHVRRIRKKEKHQVSVLEASLRILSDVFGGYFNYSCLTSLYPFAVSVH